ncbi:hypothetical protein [Yinghuangia sp. YIM S09857]|uniref:hypothetical protein n=1 Tax=Yinghuangia sp. YIM S09857 TaxID=3436929 RepID=UPI003F53B8FE
MAPAAPDAALVDPTAARAELARRQTDLLAALVAGGPVPAGFDPERIRVQSVALAAKRREGVLRTLPMLATAFGDRWPRVFMEWARTHPKPAVGGSRADAAAFAEYLAAQDELPEAVAAALSPVPPEPPRRPGIAERVRSRLRRNRENWDPDARYCSE